MTSYFSSDYNAVNLLRNGGLDFVKAGSSIIPFWELDGASLNAVPPDNAFDMVVRETQEVEHGAARYFKFLLSSDDPVTLSQEFSNRFIQMGFVDALGDPWTAAAEHLETNRPPWEHALEKKYATFDCLLVRGIPVTLAFSIRVPQGRASLKVAAVPGNGSDIESEIQSRISSEDWLRPSRALDFGHRRIRKLKIVLSRDPGAGSTEVHLGAFMLAVGASSSLPYTGDPMADAFPPDTVVMAFGDVCPPGFERMVFAAPPEAGRVFPKGGAYSSDTVEGTETHSHEDASVTMNPERHWSTVELIPAASSGSVIGDSGVSAHEHPKDVALHVPPTKDVILCRRISWSQGE